MTMPAPRLRAPIVLWPTSLDAIGESSFGYTKLRRQITERQLLPSIGDNGGARLIVLLCARRSPAAVARFIISVVVDPIKRLARRTFTHVLQERFKALPAFRETDSSAAIERELRVPRVSATLDEPCPRIVGAGLPVFPRMPMAALLVGNRATAGTEFTSPLENSLRGGAEYHTTVTAYGFNRGIVVPQISGQKAVSHSADSLRSWSGPRGGANTVAGRLSPSRITLCSQAWDRAAGKVMAGLTRRRAAERALYEQRG